jgi:predicted permease
MNMLLADLRYGLRMLAKNPAFTIAAILLLALGIGANTAIFSIVNAILLRPLPYRDPGRLAILYAVDHRTGYSGLGSVCGPAYAALRDQNQVFERIAAFHGEQVNLTGRGAPERIQGAAVTASLFPLLGVIPARGRTFLEEEHQPGRPAYSHPADGTAEAIGRIREGSADQRVVLLSQGLWRRRFDSDPSLLGETITLDGAGFTVVGIMPAEFNFPQMQGAAGQLVEPELWVPLIVTGDCSNAFLQVITRLKPGARLEQAEAEVKTINRRLDRQYHHADSGPEMTLVPLQREMVSNVRPLLLILLGAVSLVLLIACANVANLMLARATERQREIAIRSAMGAGRVRLIRQLLTESVMLSALGGGLGLLLAVWGLEILLLFVPKSLPRAGNIAIDGWVLGFTLLVSLGTGIFFGLGPAVHASRLDLNEALKEGSRVATEGRTRRRVRDLLVIGEMAMALVLLVSAGLLMKSFVLLMRVNPGFDAQSVLTMNLLLPEARYRNETQMKAFYDQSLERIRALPGVQAAGMISFGLPLGDNFLSGDFTVEGQPAPPPGASASKPLVSADYFRALGIPLLQGRSFTESDGAQAPRVAIISQSLAHRFFPRQDPLGRRLDVGFGGRPLLYTIVGVAGDVKEWGLSARAPMIIYVPYAQAPLPFLLSAAALVVRTAGDPTSLAGAVRHAVQSIDQEMPLFNVASMQQLLYKSVAEPRFNLLLFGVFAALALFLAVVGMYSVMSYSVVQRTHEIGIRRALGARESDVLRLVVGQGLKLSLAGVAIGLAGALALTRMLATLLYGIRPADPITFCWVALLLAIVALLACFVPARRAMRVDPNVALRYE